MAHEFPTPDWMEACMLQQAGVPDRTAPLGNLVRVATQAELIDRPEYLIVSPTLGELDNMQIEGLRRRPDFPDF